VFKACFGRPAEAVVETWDPAGSSGIQTVKVHDEVDARSLGLPRYENRVVKVNSETLEHLKSASWVNRIAKATLAGGAGNQKTDICASSGESWARRQIGFKSSPSSSAQGQLKRVQKAQGGNCVEHSIVTTALLAQKQLNAPVIQVWDHEIDHQYTLIGDPRDRKWGQKTPSSRMPGWDIHALQH
jgi:hypothetical protein